MCEFCGVYFGAGSDKQKDCKSECKEKMEDVTLAAVLRKDQKVPMCSDECLFGNGAAKLILGHIMK